MVNGQKAIQNYRLWTIDHELKTNDIPTIKNVSRIKQLFHLKITFLAKF
jgi:hypothetical protein